MEKNFRRRKKQIGKCWRMDEPRIKVKGKWMYLYRAVDKDAVHKFLLKAIHNNGCPEVINIDQSEANKEAISTCNRRCIKKIMIRRCKYLNNRVEADLRFIKWRIQNMLRFKCFESASRTLVDGIIKVT